MKNRFSLENDEAASNPEAAFILSAGKYPIRARILRFRTFKQLDAYVPERTFVQIRALPILLEVVDVPDELPGHRVQYWLERMATWYYHTVLRHGLADTYPVAGSEE